MSEKQALIEFHGDQIQTVRTENGIFVAMKPVVENMGLTWQSQLEKLKSQKEKYNYNDIVMVAKDGKSRDMGCIPLRKLTGWLFSINPDKVLPILKLKVEQYQEECFHVLHDYWFNKKPVQKETALIPDFTNPAEAAEAWAKQFREKEKAQLELKEAEPKIAFAEHMEKTPDSISVGAFSKYLRKNGYDIGPKKLFQKFRDLKYFRYNEKRVNEPYQRVMDYGWFEYNQFTKDVELNEGGTKVQHCSKIMVTGKGQVSITKILLRELER